jgi:hypothetical protein
MAAINYGFRVQEADLPPVVLHRPGEVAEDGGVLEIGEQAVKMDVQRMMMAAAERASCAANAADLPAGGMCLEGPRLGKAPHFR